MVRISFVNKKLCIAQKKLVDFSYFRILLYVLYYIVIIIK